LSDLLLIISDLHLADGHPILDGFGAATQSALEGLLQATSTSGSLAHMNTVELIINGDCFDFLVVPPYETNGTIHPGLALSKLEKIIAAHGPFFEALRNFVAIPGRSVTFLAGNHDIELCFAEVRTRISQAIDADTGVNFCTARSYRPLPDVYIEHGNHYDFWNHCNIWDEREAHSDEGAINSALTPETITLPIGSRYFQHAAYPVSIQYPYFDHFEPSVNTARQLALLCLLDPDIVAEIAHRTMELLSYPRKALADLGPGEEHDPQKFYEQVILDFAAFQQDMMVRKPNWVDPLAQNGNDALADTVSEIFSLRDALILPPLEAVAAICTPTVYQMGESVTYGMQQILHSDPSLRYAIAGHTHMPRLDSINHLSIPTDNAASVSSFAQSVGAEAASLRLSRSERKYATQVYINEGTWTTRTALPTSGEITPALVEWLRRPDWNAIPLRDVTQLTFAMVTACSDAASPSSASLCVWEGGTKGRYRVLA
jgi:UDP-2,3-diacylglucosamine pyrophosphatase LpxH